MNSLYETVERITQDAEFVVILEGQAASHFTLAIGDVLHGAGHHVQRLHQHSDQSAMMITTAMLWLPLALGGDGSDQLPRRGIDIGLGQG